MKHILESWRKYSLNESSYTRSKAKIDEYKIPLLLISAYRSGGNNQTNHKRIKADLKRANYSFTEVVGGGQEELEDDEGKPILDDKGKPKIQAVREMTLLVTPEARGTGDIEHSAEEAKRLFVTGKELGAKYNQLAFIFGYPQTVIDSIDNKTSQKLFIAAYSPSAPAPGEKYRIKEDWAGPWSTIERAAEDDVFFTKIAGTKATLAQEAIKRKISKIKSVKCKNQFERMKKNYHLKKWRSLLANE